MAYALPLMETNPPGGEYDRQIERLVGANLRRAREREGMSQAELGRALAPFLGKGGWSRQAVSVAENGGRDFRASELLALALILRQSVAEFFFPLDLQAEVAVAFPGGQEASANEMLLLAGAGLADDPEKIMPKVLLGRVTTDSRRTAEMLIRALETARGVATSLQQQADFLSSLRHHAEHGFPHQDDASEERGGEGSES